MTGENVTHTAHATVKLDGAAAKPGIFVQELDRAHGFPQRGLFQKGQRLGR